MSIHMLDYIKQDKLSESIRFTEWYHSSVAKAEANKLESVDYFIVHSKDKPNCTPLEYGNQGEEPMIKIGTSSGKGYGMSDDSMTDKYRTKRRKGQSQPYDRLSDHMVIMRDGYKANQIKKNIGNLKAAWSPVFEKYGFGKKLLKNVWVCFAVPTTSMNFRDSSMFCEWTEMMSINHHIHVFQGSAPLADLKYQSMGDKERRDLCMQKESAFKARDSRFANDDDYIDKMTNNNQDFKTKPADLDEFLV